MLNRIAIVARDFELLETLCDCLRRPGEFLPIFESPEDVTEDFGWRRGHIGELANILACCEAETVVFVGCGDDFIKNFPRHAIRSSIVVRDPADISKVPGVDPRKKSWKPAEALRESPSPNADFVVVESGWPFEKVLAKNLASFTHAEVIEVPSPTDDQKDQVTDWLRIWSSVDNSLTERDDALEGLLTFIRNQLSRLTAIPFKTITFITHRIPYALFPFANPTTHIFIHPGNTGINLTRGILKSTSEYLRVPVCVVVDPENTGDSESDDLISTLTSSGYLVRTAIGQKATAAEMALLTTHLPCDLISISTHAGEQTGYRVVEKFTGPDNTEHTIIYDESPSFGAAWGDQIELQLFIRPQSIDGIDWATRSDSEAKVTGPLFTHWSKLHVDGNRKERLVSREPTTFVEGSDSFGTASLPYKPITRSMGGYCMPMVLGNACSTWRSIASHFVAAGASVFVGTSRDTLNAIAVDVGSAFVKHLADGRPVAHALYRAQKKHIGKYSPYMIHGFAFTKLKPISNPAIQKRLVLRALQRSLAMWEKKALEPVKEKHRIDKAQAIAFLKREINSVMAAYSK